MLDGWLELPGEATFDPASLVFAFDVIPPASFDIERTAWVPTISFTAYVRALPARGPIQIRYEARLICEERVDLCCHIWDRAGDLVAHSTQLAGLRMNSQDRLHNNRSEI